MTFDHVLFKPERNAFYGPQNCGYYSSPEMAGLLSGDEVLQAALSAIKRAGFPADGYFTSEFNKRFIK